MKSLSLWHAVDDHRSYIDYNLILHLITLNRKPVKNNTLKIEHIDSVFQGVTTFLRWTCELM